MLPHADVSEFRHRILMQRPASPFVISNAVRGTWLGAGPPPSGGPDRRFRAAQSSAGWRDAAVQISQLWARSARDGPSVGWPEPALAAPLMAGKPAGPAGCSSGLKGKPWQPQRLNGPTAGL